jgi:hypothetical protein
LEAVRAGKDISDAVTRRNLFRLRLINNSRELTPAGAAVLESKPPRRKKFGVARKPLDQVGWRIRFGARLGGAFQIQQPYNLSRVSDVTTCEQVGESLHVVIRQFGHRHTLAGTSLARRFNRPS